MLPKHAFPGPRGYPPLRRRANVPARRARGRALPAWPFTTLFSCYPLIWLSGLSPFSLPLIGLVCWSLMALRGRVRLPRLWFWWVSYLIWSLATIVMVDTGGRLIGFVQRWTNLAGALLIAVYVFNARESLPRRRVLSALTWMFGWLVIGGYLGMAFPHGRVQTPILRLMPDSIANNSYVLELLSPRFAEVQTPWGAPAPFVRPSAPFPYTNGWGHAFVLLLPIVVALALDTGRRERFALAVLGLAAIPPALATLNRGIFVGVGVGGGYLTVRGLRHIRRAGLVPVVCMLLFGAIAAGGLVASGAPARITARTSTSSTTQDRLAIYREAFTRTLDSPWFGNGAPRPSQTLNVSVGTQGQFWYVMFSHGFVGLLLFLMGVWGLAVVTRRVRDRQSIFLHVPLVCMSVLLIVYGVDGLHLVIVLTCAALLLRPELPPRRQDLVPGARSPAAVYHLTSAGQLTMEASG